MPLAFGQFLLPVPLRRLFNDCGGNVALSKGMICAGQRVLCVLLAGVLGGCHGYSVTGGPGQTVAPSLATRVSRNADLLGLNSIVLMPIEFDRAARGKIAHQEAFDGELVKAMRQELPIEIIAASEVFPALKPFQLGDEFAAPQISKEEALGRAKQLGSDAVMTTRVQQYVERLGSGMGAEQPAWVEFSVNLYRAADGKEIWRANYSFKDQALSDNLFRAKDRLQKKDLGWRSAQALLLHGFEIAAQDLAKRRLAQFVPTTG